MPKNTRHSGLKGGRDGEGAKGARYRVIDAIQTLKQVQQLEVAFQSVC